MNDVHNDGGAPSGAPPRHDVYLTAGRNKPKTNWSETGILQVDYLDNVRIKIDRTKPEEIDILLWKLGDTSPFEIYTADVPDRFFVVRSTETGTSKVWSLQQLVDEINRDRRGNWQDYTPANWREGWQEFVEGKDYELITLEPCTRREAEQEQTRQLRSPESDHPRISTPIRDGEASHLFTVLEIYELKSFAIGFAKAIDHYLDAHKFIDDDWITYTLPSGEITDIQFSLNEDPATDNFNKIEAFAHQTFIDNEGRRCTNTDDCVRLI